MFPVAVFLAILLVIRRLKRRRLEGVLAAFERAGSKDAVIEGTSVVTGTIGARRVRYELEEGSDGSPDTTTITTALERGSLLLEMHLSSETPADVELVAKGQQVDVEIGDSSFDALVVVEAAPADVARAFLDEATRAGVLAQMPCELSLDAKTVRLHAQRRIVDGEAAAALALVCTFAARRATVARELADAERTGASSDALGGYRPVSLRPLDPERHAREASELKAMRAARARRAFKNELIFVAVAGIALLGILLLGARR